MNLAQVKTAHFWLQLAGNVCGVSLALLIMMGATHVLAMGGLALGLLVLNHAGITTAAAWLPDSVRAKLRDADLEAYVAKASQQIATQLAASPAPVAVVAPEAKVIVADKLELPNASAE